MPIETHRPGWPKPLRVFMGTALGLLTLSLVSAAICRFVLHLDYPYKSPLLFEHYPDLLTLEPRFRYFHTLRFFTDEADAFLMYPAPVAVCYRLLFFLIPHELAFFLIFVVSAGAVAAALFGRSLHRAGLTVSSAALFAGLSFLTSYPLWFELRQANMEIFPWIALGLGLWCFARGKDTPAAVCIGIAGALKITPFLYLGLFLSRRQYRQIVTGLLAAFAVTLPSLWLEYPNPIEAWRRTSEMIARFRYIVTLRMVPQVGFDHSIFGLLKHPAVHVMNYHHVDQFLTIYSAVAFAALVVLYFVRIRKLPMINQVLCLCVATLTIPPTSFDYTLLNLYMPWAMLTLLAVQNRSKDRKILGLIPVMACFAILFVPETEFIYRALSYGGQLKAITLLVLFAIALSQPFIPTDSRMIEVPGVAESLA